MLLNKQKRHQQGGAMIILNLEKTSTEFKCTKSWYIGLARRMQSTDPLVAGSHFWQPPKSPLYQIQGPKF